MAIKVETKRQFEFNITLSDGSNFKLQQIGETENDAAKKLTANLEAVIKELKPYTQ